MSFDEDDPYWDDFLEEYEPKEVEYPIWTTIDPFICYFCKTLNEFTQYSIFEDKQVPYKVPIYSNCSYSCKKCHTPNIVFSPYDYEVIKRTKGFGNLSSLIY